MKLKLTLTSLLALAVLVGLGVAVEAKPTLSTPTITCGTSTGSSISIHVTAGATGLPAGFTVQWLTLAEYQLNGWGSALLCDASFSGVPSCSQYNLAAGQSIDVQIGDNLFDMCGESSSCASTPLQCGTQYVFRAFGHANSTYNRSAFTPNLTCSTLPCGGGDCTFTQGYWKTHGNPDCNPSGGADLWPQAVIDLGLMLGTNTYTEEDLCSILNTAPAGGNGLVSLAHQLIAAKLNIANGASHDAAIDSAIASADAMIGSKVIPPVGGDFLPSSTTSALTTTLDNYNSGLTGPGHCP
jgi:hypothetical protein